MGLRIINADFLTCGELEDNSIDLTVTSPPYNLGMEYDSISDIMPYSRYLEWSSLWLNKLFMITKETGRLCLNVPLDISRGGERPIYADVLKEALHLGWKYKCTIIWNEGNISKGTAWGSWCSASAPYVIAPVEAIVVLYKGSWKRNRKGESTISADDFKHWTKGMWTFNGENPKRVGHPAPFPVELPKRCIELFSYKDDVILDPFCGSGSSLVACVECGRKNAIGIDISAEYCELSKKRIKK